MISQTDINLDNNLTGIYSNSNIKSLDLSTNGINHFSYKSILIGSNTSYLLSLNDKKIVGNELIQRTSFDYKKKYLYQFFFHQYTSSLIRNINRENCVGIGTGVKRECKNSNFNFSYAIMCNIINRDQETLRHSFRFKYRIEKKIFTIYTEYFFQPNIYKFNDYIIIGTTTIGIFPDRKVNLLIQDMINIRSKEKVTIIHTLTIGLGIKFNKTVK